MSSVSSIIFVDMLTICSDQKQLILLEHLNRLKYVNDHLLRLQLTLIEVFKPVIHAICHI